MTESFVSASNVMLQVLEAIRASNPELIADNMPKDWGMNKLRNALQKQPQFDQQKLDLQKLATVIDCARSYVEDIESGIEDGTYLKSENENLPELQVAVENLEAWHRHTALAQQNVNAQMV